MTKLNLNKDFEVIIKFVIQHNKRNIEVLKVILEGYFEFVNVDILYNPTIKDQVKYDFTVENDTIKYTINSNNATIDSNKATIENWEDYVGTIYKISKDKDKITKYFKFFLYNTHHQEYLDEAQASVKQFCSNIKLDEASNDDEGDDDDDDDDELKLDEAPCYEKMWGWLIIVLAILCVIYYMIKGKKRRGKNN